MLSGHPPCEPPRHCRRFSCLRSEEEGRGGLRGREEERGNSVGLQSFARVDPKVFSRLPLRVCAIPFARRVRAEEPAGQGFFPPAHRRDDRGCGRQAAPQVTPAGGGNHPFLPVKGALGSTFSPRDRGRGVCGKEIGVGPGPPGCREVSCPCERQRFAPAQPSVATALRIRLILSWGLRSMSLLYGSIPALVGSRSTKSSNCCTESVILCFCIYRTVS